MANKRFEEYRKMSEKDLLASIAYDTEITRQRIGFIYWALLISLALGGFSAIAIAFAKLFGIYL